MVIPKSLSKCHSSLTPSIKKETTPHNPWLDTRVEVKKETTKNNIWLITVFVLVAAYWIAKGTPSPELFFTGSTAKQACIELANKNKGTFLISNNAEIRANDTWIKDGKRVVQLIQEVDENMRQVMCIYGNGMVQIPSLFDQARWR
jgi:hypothetical protein